LEAEHQPVAHLPRRARRAAARVHLRERVVERAAAGRACGEHLRDVLALAEERLTRPRLGAERSGGERVGRLGEDDRLNGFLHVRSTSFVLQTSKRRSRSLSPLGEPLPPTSIPLPAGASTTACRRDQTAGPVPVGVPELPSPPKMANGFPGTVSQTSSPPGSTSPWMRPASASASSREAAPTIRYCQRRSTG